LPRQRITVSRKVANISAAAVLTNRTTVTSLQFESLGQLQSVEDGTQRQ